MTDEHKLHRALQPEIVEPAEPISVLDSALLAIAEDNGKAVHLTRSQAAALVEYIHSLKDAHKVRAQLEHSVIRIFQIEYSKYGVDITYAVIELDQEVIDAVDDSWREVFYPLYTPADIARHICYNMVENRLPLSSMDGWADKDNSLAKMLDWPDFDFDMEAREIGP